MVATPAESVSALTRPSTTSADGTGMPSCTTVMRTWTRGACNIVASARREISFMTESSSGWL
jgi:hypothetical protein